MIGRRWTLGVMFLLGLVACHESSSGGTSATSSASSTLAIAPSMSSAPHPHHGGNGVSSILFAMARTLPTVTDDQKTKMDALEDAAEDHDASGREAMKGFSTELSAEIRAGKIEPAKLQPSETALDTAVNASFDKQATALSGLHDMLDGTQRTALAEAVHAKFAANAPPDVSTHDAGAIADKVTRQVDRMASDLTLDDTQKKQVTALVTKEEKTKAAHPEPDKRKALDALLTAFQADSFDAKKGVEQATLDGKAPHDAMDEQIKFTAALVAILHPDQCAKLAAAAERPPMMGRGMGGPSGGMGRPGGMRGGMPMNGMRPAAP